MLKKVVQPLLLWNHNYVYFYCKLFGIISLAIGILTLIGIIFIINSIQWIDYEEYLKNDKYNNSEEEELGEIREEIGEESDEDDDEKSN